MLNLTYINEVFQNVLNKFCYKILFTYTSSILNNFILKKKKMCATRASMKIIIIFDSQINDIYFEMK